MLNELRISNFAIIEEQSIEFGKGLNVISGQTGSGKSIILNALELILGARPRSSLIRQGAEELIVEGSFDLSALNAETLNSLPDIARTEELVLCRTINQTGKGKVFINGRAGTVSLLQEIAQKLINICGQGQHINLLDPQFHLDLIDEYAGNRGLLEEYSEIYRRQKDLLKLQKQYISDRESSEKRKFESEETYNELKKPGLYKGIRAELEGKVKKLDSSEKLVGGFQEINAQFSADESPIAQLSIIISALNDLSRYDPAIKEFVDRGGNVRMQLQELELDLNRYANNLSLNEEELEILRERLAEVARLERKYKTEDQGLLELLEKSKLELENYTSLGNLKELEEKIEENNKKLLKLSKTLSEKRIKLGSTLIAALEKDLASLNMPDAKFRLEAEETDLTSRGRDKIEILISTNKGELFKPLRQIASGGELSRIMLVLKKNLKDKSGVNVLVFDEVDSGISGSVARAVGQKLKSLSEFSQVICITHLAQIASLSDRHILVDKTVKDRTLSVVKVIDGEEKIEEIARMLAGYEVTPAARKSAKELIISNK
jgi:DNA repair protein RecN (Recombination protein N)